MVSFDTGSFIQHSLKEFPKEACGVVVNDSYIPCKNIATDPEKNFQISAIELASIAAQHGKVQAVLHSHPMVGRSKWPAQWPSHHDMVQWLKGDIPWGIVATEGENCSPLVWMDEATIAPLEGREFVHGVWDCYSTVRDWYRVERGVTVPNFPRGMEWWDKGANHYEDNFEKAGFIEISRDELQIGDAVLMRVKSPVINHAAVVTGSNQIIHHLFHRKSGFDDFNKWERFYAKYVRLRENNDKNNNTAWPIS